MKHVVSFSGGGGSWAAAKRVAAAHGTDDLTLLFCDTIVEDNDLYRFIIEGAANVVGGPPMARMYDLCQRAVDLVPIWVDEDRRKAQVEALRQDVVDALPWLVWLSDGRTPWDVFADERYLGNSGVDPCSKILKREMADRWLRANRNSAETVCYVGIDWTEEHRFEGHPATETRPAKLGLRQRRAAAGWTYRAPLCEPPLITKHQAFAWMEREGLRRPRLYGLGFSHNNCMGACVKAGHAQWVNLLRQIPEHYAYCERKEQQIRALLGKDVSILRDRKGGTSKPLTLRELRQRIEAGADYDMFDLGGCGCFLDEDDEEAA